MADVLLLSDGASRLLLSNGTDVLLLSTGGAIPTPSADPYPYRRTYDLDGRATYNLDARRTYTIGP
jgi:hypothetical protein